MENHLDKITVLDELCEKHGTPLWQFPYMSRGQEHISKMCQVCTQEGIALTEQETLEVARNRQRYVTTYNVLIRDSTVPEELREATFENFKAETAEEKQMLEFARGQVEKYKQGMTGNTLITGQTGIGKSHLSFAMAKALNEYFKEIGEPKSVLFVSLTEIIKQIKNGWNYGKGANLTEFDAVEQLTKVDFLILDDLGAKNATIAPKSDWEQDFLFDILNNRETTIINTNLNSQEIKTVYNARNASRIFKGLEGNSFKAFSISDKRYSINKLKKGE
ncbi:TPA: ATP-binding protein [Streptococcus suis]|uniref:Zinc finger protein n=1 Tax=Streptococcus suis TaxID=1307 RepID=A0A116Q209_STRSU|nr:ATP-binding protein [Streptococcus suis]MDW8726673.1 ATP-binding protein [Streptococcus suis]NQN59415.1 ATP-binding protein [Streptococcus suis]NQP74680.1 ATP-binding protein [Streptococcus suis]NQP76695.1 ATP-binding protein [Streptococcus suis]NQP90938.1 ATP-binding protein [Streptococcus suis]